MVDKELRKKTRHKYYLSHKKEYHERQKKWRKNNPDKMRGQAKRAYGKTDEIRYRILRSKNKKRFGSPDFLSKSDYINWRKNEPKVCVYCGIPEELLEKNPMFSQNNKLLSVDRIDNSKPYIIGNITLACSRCNFVKSDIFTEDEMKEIGKILRGKWNV